MKHNLRTSSPASCAQPGLLAAALLVPLVFFVANLLANHVLGHPPFGPVGGLLYWLAVDLVSGTMLPALVLLNLRKRGVIDTRKWGYSFLPIDIVKIFVALAASVAIAAFAISGSTPKVDRLVRLFVWLVGASLAEVMVFLGIVYNVAENFGRLALPQSSAMAVAAIIASSAFGLFHFSYSQPWNSWPVAFELPLVWLAVTAVFLITHSLWAAAVFNNVMAVIGFVLNRVTEFDERPLWLGLTLAVISILTLLALPRIVRSPPPSKVTSSRV